MKKTICMTLAALALASTGSARTWTNADGSKTFEGDFVSANADSVTVKVGFKELTFKMDLLSEEDQKWAKVEGVKAAAAAANREGAAEFAESDFGKSLKKLQKFEGTKFVTHELEEAPKYFLLYFSASW